MSSKIDPASSSEPGAQKQATMQTWDWPAGQAKTEDEVPAQKSTIAKRKT
jgi:hypothetical protein